MKIKREVKRCEWAKKEVFHKYHDKEWGKVVKRDNKHFEYITLEGAQAGLSWETVLKKREGYKKAFKNFDILKVSKMTSKDVERLMENEDIVRNRLKINSVIKNAKVFLNIRKEFGSFNKFIWSFSDNKTIVYYPRNINQMKTKTNLSDKISKELKKKGMSFVGSTIIHSYMQAIGMVNEHERDCYFK